MGGERCGVGDGKFQNSNTTLLILFFLLTCRVVQCEESPDDVNKDNEVPILNESLQKDKPKVNSTQSLNPKFTQPKEQHKDDDKKDEKDDQDSDNISDKNMNEIVPAIKIDKSDGDPESKTEKQSIVEDANKTADHEKDETEVKNSVSDTPKDKNKSDKAEEKVDASEKVSGGGDQTETKDSNTSKENNRHDSDSSNKSGSDTSDKAVSDNAVLANETVPNVSKPDSGNTSDTDHSKQPVSTSNLTSPSLSEQSVKTDPEPQEYFQTLKPKVANPENGSNFSFFRLFILTSVVFVALYVGYYYRQKIKRHFGYNGNEIYYHPLRTMQHNAVD